MHATLADGWADHSSSVIPEDAGSVQRKECKSAFYAGARILLSIMVSSMEGTDQEQLVAAHRTAIALDGELEKFVAEITRQSLTGWHMKSGR